MSGPGPGTVPEPDVTPSRTISGGGAASVGIASIVAAGCGYAVLLLAARVLDTAQNADFLVFWALVFGVFGVLGGIQNESTRASHPTAAGPRGAAILPWGLAVGGIAAVAVGGTSVWWAPRVLGDDWALGIVAVCVGAVLFAGHVASAGVLAGRLRWGGYSVLVGAESAARLVLVAAVVLAGGRLVGMELAVVLASGVWLVLVLAVPGMRSVRGARSDVGPRRLLANTGNAAVAAAASAALVVGFPVLLRLTTGEVEFESAAPLILAISVTRAPLLMPLAAYQGVAIAHFMAHRQQGVRALTRVVVLITVVGVLAAGAAALVGPWVLRLLFGPEYGVPGLVLGGLTLGATALAVLTITGAAVLATGNHVLYAVGWATATVTSLGILLLPLDIETRAVLSLALGPLVGLVVHGVAIERASAAPTAAEGLPG